MNLKSDWVLTETVGNGCEFVIKRTYDPALLFLFSFNIYSSVRPYCKVSMIFVVSLFKDETKYHYDFRVCRPNSVKILQVCYILSSNYFQIKYFTSLCINIVDLFSFSFSMAFCFPFK